MATLADVENGFVEKFLANAAVTARIGRKFYKVACKEWIASLESVNQERPVRLGEWCDYRRSGQTIRALKAPTYESNAAFATWEIRCYSYLMDNAEALLDLVMDVIGTGFVGTLGDVSVRKAHWLYENMASDYDETFKQAWASVGLSVRYLRS